MTRRIHPVGGRVIVVTGAARGIGAESARRLAARGARVALIDVDGEGLERVAGQCPGSSWRVADVTDDAGLRAAVDAVAGEWGGIDVVVANAGVARLGSAVSMDPVAFEEILSVNLVGAWRTARAALPHLLARQGYLLTISSLAAVVHAPGIAAYSASKAGLEAMCDSLRGELAPRGVGVGVAYFSWIDTELLGPEPGAARERGPRAIAPPPFHRVHPVGEAGAVVVRAIEARRSRAFHPAWLRAVLPVRGLLQPGLERRLASRRGTGRKPR